ncbi:COG1470 family protein [Streptomyces sp. B21-083]|uniref:COG1470 family protein n=1 Tax=Streptomyces sp. B21-083 TaxID=3039410 RepID=UPI002FF0B381
MRVLSPSLSHRRLLGLLGLVALLSTGAPAVADEGWSVTPLGTGRPYFYAEGTPKTVLQDTLSVRNPTKRTLDVRLTGSGWITLAAPVVEVPARTRADVPFTVRVPEGTPPGDRTATITARASGRTATVRVRLRVGGPRLPALTVEHVAVRGERIAYELVNRGTTDLTPTLAVRADGVLGPLLDRAPRTLPVRLPPGRRLALTEPWSERPAFDAVDVRLTVTAADGTVRDEAGTSVRFVPWGGVAGVAGALTAGVALVVVRRLGRRRRDEQPCARQELAAETDELTGAMT